MFSDIKKRIPYFFFLLLTLLSACFLAACGSNVEDSSTTRQGGSEVITPSQAKEIMDNQTDFVILDVRTQEEYDAGHIANAILLPDSEIKSQAETQLPDKDQLILVYCRSGRRSAASAKELVSLGYTNVKDFGGIIDWPYELAD